MFTSGLLSDTPWPGKRVTRRLSYNKGVPFAAALLAATLAAGCESDTLMGACGVCEPGTTCVDGRCVQLCNRDRDCGGCNVCVDGLCSDNACAPDPCSLCTASEVCYGQECLPACSDTPDCEAGEVCYAAPGGNVCVPEGRITTVIPVDSYHVSGDSNVMVKGGVRYVGGVTSSSTYTVTPVIE